MRGRTRRSKGPEENTGADAGSSYSVGAVRTDTRDMRAQEAHFNKLWPHEEEQVRAGLDKGQ